MSDLVDLLMKSLVANPSDWNVRKAIIDKMLEEGNVAGYVELIRSAPSAPEDPQMAIQLAEIVQGVDPDCALRLVEGGLVHQPSSGQLHFMKANLLLNTGRSSEAETHYTVAKTIDSRFASPEFEQRLGASAGIMSAAAAPAQPVAVAPEPQPMETVEEPAAVAVQLQEEAPIPTEFEMEPEIPVEKPAPVPVNQLPVLRPLVDPSTVPDLPRLNTAEAGQPKPAMNFTPNEDLQATRSHLAVFDATGAPIDADSLLDDEWLDEEPEILACGSGHAPQAVRPDDTKEKVGAVLTTILVHAAIALLLWVLVISVPKERPPEITATTLSNDSEQVTKRNLPRKVQQKPSAPSQNVAQIVTAATTATISAPTVDFNVEAEVVDLGTSIGFGSGFGAGGTGGGGTFSFMGNSGSGKRVVFAVDYSASMKRDNREALMKEELSKSISRLPRGSQYQVLFFSGFAWPHNEVKDEWLKDRQSWGPRNDNLLKKMRPFGSSGRLQNDASDLTIPKYKYLTATSENISMSRRIVEEMPLTYGTNWEHPVIMALSVEPKPDIIFFMTDGAVGNPNKAIDAITELNEKGKPCVINTTAMMEPRAAKELSVLAEKNRGKFTIVLDGGKVVKGEEFLRKN